MRLWHIDPAYLDSKRVGAQNNECHGLLTCILKGQQWGAISEQFKTCIGYIKIVHDNIATEMGIRKGLSPTDALLQHPSQMWLEGIPPRFLMRQYCVSVAEFVTDVQQLRAKWDREGYYYGVGRKDLRELERRYNLPEGPSVEECARTQAYTRLFWETYRKQAPTKGVLGARLDFFREKGMFNPF